MRPSRFVILCVVAAMVLMPMPAQAGIPGDFDPLPFGPETGVFYITHTPAPSQVADCKSMVRENHTDPGFDVFLVAVNDLDARCASLEKPSGGNNRNFRAVSSFEPIFVYMMPSFNNVTMDTTKTITMTLHAYTEGAGGVRPTVILTIGNWSGKDHGGPFEPHTSGANGWQTIELDFGAPPELLNGPGLINITVPAVHGVDPGVEDGVRHGIKLGIQHGYNTSQPTNPPKPTANPSANPSADPTVDPTVDDPSPGRLAAPRWGMGIDAEHQSVLRLPFDVQPVPPKVEPESIVCSGADGSNVTVEVTDAIKSCDDYALMLDNDANDADGNITDGNVSTNAHGGARGDHEAGNNTTVDTEEEGIPGFGTAMIIVATGLIAFAGHQRRLQAPRRR